MKTFKKLRSLIKLRLKNQGHSLQKIHEKSYFERGRELIIESKKSAFWQAPLYFGLLIVLIHLGDLLPSIPKILISIPLSFLTFKLLSVLSNPIILGLQFNFKKFTDLYLRIIIGFVIYCLIWITLIVFCYPRFVQIGGFTLEEAYSWFIWILLGALSALLPLAVIASMKHCFEWINFKKDQRISQWRVAKKISRLFALILSWSLRLMIFWIWTQLLSPLGVYKEFL